MFLAGQTVANTAKKGFKKALRSEKCCGSPALPRVQQPCSGKHALDDAHCMDRISAAAHKHGQALQRAGKSGNEHPRRTRERGKQQTV